MKSVIDLWANFLANEKLVPDRLNPEDIQSLIRLSEALAEIQRPWISSHEVKLATRRVLCSVAMDLEIDLPAIKHKISGKFVIGRGLLDMWLKVYQERFGDVYGTQAFKEAIRRDVKTRLSREVKASEENATKVQAIDSARIGG
jgi:hypothetical protein